VHSDAGRGADEVVVVGGGVVGLACAWRIAQTGRRVLVLERDEPGAGASGVAAGMLAAVAEADFGEGALLRLRLEAADAWPAFAAELTARTGIELEYGRCGALVLAVDSDDVEELRRVQELRHGLGLGSEWLTGRDCRRLEPALAPRVRAGMLTRDDGQVDPRAVVRALREAIRREGGELRAGVAVEGIDETGNRVRGVRLAGGEVLPTRAVVVAAGAWSASLDVCDPPPVRPVKGQVLRLRGGVAGPLAQRIVWTPRCYVVSRPSGEVVVGATVEERGFDTTVTAGAVRQLLEDAREVLPDVEERELVEARAGLRPGTPGNAPVVGPGGSDGLFWATGHYRNGILLAPITADAIAALIHGAGPPPPFRDFAASRTRSEGASLAGSTA